MMNKIILASQSPRRKQLLEWAEIPFDIIVKSTSEDYPPGLHPEQIAVHIAQQKAYGVQKQISNDQTIDLVLWVLFIMRIYPFNKAGIV